ncbi:hypothetical protein [Candidatus Amarolinea dominans]|uniref:hypothetical protein n=1 Tax=Candidatus Amarolinea dominans TaxID=3140696 RepID=UPI003135EA52|nr:hypothetical protein [Anaerolineae bacterium]MBK9229684.1 hypothetical protein [Anaerolineae bacterium]
MKSAGSGMGVFLSRVLDQRGTFDGSPVRLQINVAQAPSPWWDLVRAWCFHRTGWRLRGRVRSTGADLKAAGH